MKSLSLTILLSVISFYGFCQAPSVFKHPGIFNSQTELSFIKNTVAANNESPIVAGYQTLSTDSKGNLSYNPEPYAVVDVVASGTSPAETAFRRDAHAAYIHAIEWVVTGDDAHRDKALEILNTWATTFQSLSTAPDKPNQPTLEASWALPIWLASAEIMKTYDNGAAGWDSGDISQFESFVTKIINYVNGPIASAPNWYISKGLSLMSAGVFLDDADTYNAGYNIIVPQLDAITTAGQIPELTRDFVHSQYVLIGLTQAAEVAYQQEDNTLFTRTSGASAPRLLLGAEYYTKCLLGTNTPNYQSASNWARKSAPYEILLLRYTELDMSVPNTETYVLTQNRVENGAEDHFLGWLTATHSQLAKPQTPFNETAFVIPGKIEAEDYDKGGQDVAYNDLSPGNSGNIYRTDSVDLQSTTDEGGGYVVTSIEQNEWVEYTIQIDTAGIYALTARVAANADGKTFHAELNGQDISGTIAVPNTSSDNSFTSVTVTTTELTTGKKTLRLVMDSDGFNINYLEFKLISISQAPKTGSATPIPGTMEAEDYDLGEPGIAFNDLSEGNEGGAYRHDAVDIEVTADTLGDYNITSTEADEWLAYTVDIKNDGAYNLTARVAANEEGKTFHVELDGENISGAIEIPNTGSLETFTSVEVETTVITKGEKVMRVVMDSPGFKLNFLSFELQPAYINLALNKSATSSSIEGSGLEAANAVDGNTGTRWSSAFSDPQWISVDLGDNYEVNRVKITWENAYAKAYRIEISSNGTSWRTMDTVTGNNTLVNDRSGLSGIGRYIRIYGTSRATAYGYSIFELEVYGALTDKVVTGVNEIQERTTRVYPNPTSGNIMIDARDLREPGTVTLYKTSGEMVCREKIKDQIHTMSLGSLSSGLYLLRISNAKEQLFYKVVKEN